MTPSWLNWKRGLGIAGALGVLVAAAALTHRSELACGRYVLGRWSAPYFAVSAVVGVLGVVLVILAVALDEQRARRAGEGLLVATLSLGLTLGAVDVAMRLTKPPRVYRPPFYDNHDTLGYFFSPNAQHESVYLDRGFREVFRTDENGFIIRGGSNKPNPRAHRLLFLGDSFLAGMQVRAEQNVSVKTTEYLEAATGQPYQAINAGAEGFSPIQYLLAYRTFADMVDPQTVIAAVFVGNDFTGDARLVLADRVIMDEQGQLLAVRPSIDYEHGLVWSTPFPTPTRLEDMHPPLVPGQVWRKGLLSVGHALVLVPLCQQLDITSFDPATYDPADRPPEPIRDGEGLACQDMSGELTDTCTNYPIRNESLVRNNSDAIFKDNYTDFDREDIATSLDALRLLAQEVEAEGRAFVLVIIPVSSQVPNQAEGIKAARGLRPGEVITSTAPQDLLGEFCEAAGLDCIDLLPVFTAHSDEPIYLVNNTHLGPQGHALMAETIAAHLLEKP